MNPKSGTFIILGTWRCVGHHTSSSCNNCDYFHQSRTKYRRKVFWGSSEFHWNRMAENEVSIDNWIISNVFWSKKMSHSSYVNEKKWRWCYSEKFTILLTIFELISWKFSLGAGAPFYVGLQKKKILFAAPRNPFCRKFYGLWCFLCKFYSEKFPIFRAIFVIFFGSWLLDARATFRL